MDFETFTVLVLTVAGASFLFFSAIAVIDYIRVRRAEKRTGRFGGDF